MADNLFISYRRKDVEFVKQLVEGLQENGKTVWVDWEDIPPGSVGFTDDIHRGIENAESFLCVLSPDYLESDYTKMELDYAIQLNKKLIPVVLRKFDGYEVPSGIGHINWIYFTPHAGQENTFEESFPKIIDAIDIDLEHVQQHTKLLTRAIDWDKKGRPDSLVLRGDDLNDYYHWWSEATDKDPKPTQLQIEYILASRKAAERRRRVIFGALLLGLIISVTLSIIAVAQTIAAEQARGVAQQERQRAEEEEANAQSLLLSDQAQRYYDESRVLDGIALALLAAEIGDPPAQSQRILSELAYQPGIHDIFEGHSSQVTSVAIRPDGSTALTGSTDGNAIYWDIEAGREISRYSSPEFIPVRSVTFHPTDPNIAVVGMLDWSIVFWDLTTGAEVNRLGGIRSDVGHTGAVNAITFTPDGDRMLTGSSDGTLILWNLNTGDIVSRYGGKGFGHTAQVRSVDISSDGVMAVSGSDDSNAIVWDLRTGRIIHEMTAHTDDVYSVSFSPDDSQILTASRDSTMILWDVSMFTVDVAVRFRDAIDNLGHTAGVRGAVFSPDGINIVSAGEDGRIIVWDRTTGDSIHELLGVDPDGQELNIAITDNGRYAISGSNAGRMTYWNITNEAIELYFEGHLDSISAVAYAPNGEMVATSSFDNTVIVWDAQTSEILGNLGGHDDRVNTVIFNEDSTLLASGGDDGRILIWDVENREILHEIVVGQNVGVTALHFTQDDAYIIAALDNNRLARWNIERGELARVYLGHERRVLSIDLSPDGETLVSGGADAAIITWDVETGDVLNQNWLSFRSGDLVRILSVAYSADGEYIATGALNGNINIWDADNLQSVNAFETDDDPVWAIDFSPDGENIISGTGSGLIVLWDVQTGRALRSFGEHRAAVVGIAYSPDGTTVMSGSRDSIGYMWTMPDLDVLIEWTKEHRKSADLSCAFLNRYSITLEDGNCEADVPSASLTTVAPVEIRAPFTEEPQEAATAEGDS